MEDHQAARSRLIVALDTPTVADARALIATLGPAVTFYKFGLELVLSGGLQLVDEIRQSGRSVFLDMKLLDIANTVTGAVAAADRLGVSLLTIHGIDRKTVAAAIAGRPSGSDMKILGVTVLTSLDADDLAEQGVAASPADLVVHRAKLIIDAGADGVVASGQEAASVRAAVGPGPLIVTPGIRLPGDAAGDQARVATPSSAIAAGATHLVVGRPITRADDPAKAADRFVTEIDAALSGQA